MKFNRPKKDVRPIKLKNKTTSNEVRYNYGKEITYKTPVLPKPLEYEDIDIAFKDFVKNEINIECEGKLVPTFTLYSNQRFSEYSQTWQHTDENNNLLMNFKTIVRDKNPRMGTNQGNRWSIPGERRYTLLIREVMDENNVECYEIHSMKQPYTVDLLYKVSFITNKFEKINEFNQRLNKLFASRQCYIRPNGHFIPMVLEDVSDDTEYNIENRKFYTQSCDIKVMAYIINEEDFKIERKPKRVGVFMDGDMPKYKPNVEIEETDINENLNNFQGLNVFIDFNELQSKSKFIIDTDMVIHTVSLVNVRNYRVWVNDTPIYTEKGFKVKENDEIIVKITPLDFNLNSKVIFNGYNENIKITDDNLEKNINIS